MFFRLIMGIISKSGFDVKNLIGRLNFVATKMVKPLSFVERKSALSAGKLRAIS